MRFFYAATTASKHGFYDNGSNSLHPKRLLNTRQGLWILQGTLWDTTSKRVLFCSQSQDQIEIQDSQMEKPHQRTCWPMPRWNFHATRPEEKHPQPFRFVRHYDEEKNMSSLFSPKPSSLQPLKLHIFTRKDKWSNSSSNAQNSISKSRRLGTI